MEQAAVVNEIKGLFQEIRELYKETDRKFQNDKIGMSFCHYLEFVPFFLRCSL